MKTIYAFYLTILVVSKIHKQTARNMQYEQAKAMIEKIVNGKCDLEGRWSKLNGK